MVPWGGAWSVPLGGAGVTPAPVLLAWTAAMVAGREAYRGRLPRVGPARAPLLGVAALLAALALAAWPAPDLALALAELARWALLAVGLWLAAGLESEADRALVLAAIVAAGAAEAAMGAWGAMHRQGPEAFAILGGRLYRAHGHFGQPNPFGAYLNQVWPLAVAPAVLLALRPAGRGERGRGSLCAALFGVGGLACLAALLLTWSRGAWLAALAAGAAMAIVALAGAMLGAGRGRALGAVWLAATLGTAALLAGGLERLPASVVDRLASSAQGGGLVFDVTDAEVSDANFAKVERLAHWRAALAMWADRPWTGQGPGHFEAAYERFRLPRWREPLGHAHNLYLHLLAEAGLPGLAGLLLFLGAALLTALRAASRPDQRRAALGLGACGVVAAVAAHSLLDHVLVHDMAPQLGLILGLAAGGRRA
jgi:O-antigen ligase